MDRDMFDTMTLTKAVGGLCGTFLVFLLGGWAAEIIYHGAGGHGDGHEMAYVIHAAEDQAEVPVVEGPSFDEIYASADASAGGTLFPRQCSACHSDAAGDNGTGPYLHGVVGRATGSVDGFGYSGSLVAVVAEWTPAELDAFLAKPNDYAPGTAMTYGGMRDAEDRANLIAWQDALDE
jgi:cytochrome c